MAAADEAMIVCGQRRGQASAAVSTPPSFRSYGYGARPARLDCPARGGCRGSVGRTLSSTTSYSGQSKDAKELWNLWVLVCVAPRTPTFRIGALFHVFVFKRL